MTEINMNLIENARMHTTMLRTRYRSRHKMRMLQPIISNKQKKKKKRSHHVPPLHPSAKQMRPTQPPLSRLTYIRKQQQRKRNRRMLVSNENKENKQSNQEHFRFNKNMQTTHSIVKRQPKASSLPLIVPKLRLKTLSNHSHQRRHSSEPISSRHTQKRQKRDHVLPKLQCLKSHRRAQRINFDKLSQRWFELTFLLRNDMESVKSFKYTQKMAKQSLLFLDKINEIAQKLGILRGTLSRSLLPFNSNTAVSDQANVSLKNSNNANSILCKLDRNTRQIMQMQAIALRKLVKVKIADDADLDQCKTALLSIQSFCADTLQFCAINNISLESMLCKLNV